MRVLIIVGSVRHGRFSKRVADWVFEEAKKRNEFEVELVDLIDFPLPFFEEAFSPLMAKEPYLNENVRKLSVKVEGADSFIVVTPEYNHGYPAVLKNMFDYIYREWNKKAVGFVSYGGVGGARSVEQLRQVVIELQMAPIRQAIHIPPQLFFDIMMNKIDVPNLFDILKFQLDSFFDDLIWWTNALKNARETNIYGSARI
ncbi:MAG TPA: NAD(P)H-dependent oxidoreductase [Candidatus Nanoarchaeia archaeon]|nr:NAD(P)H-dependent oxidoreductase [Candidatus Nanoarchaeia archaeon]